MKRPWVGAVVIVLIAASLAAAQVPQGEIAGTVTDESGAVLPGVTVTAVLGTTKETRTAASDSSGRYRFNNLPVGLYTIQAELSGFGSVKIEGYKLSIGQSTILDLKMKIATVATEITVTAAAPLIDSTKSDLSGAIDELQVKELPVIGRNWLGFAMLAPGMKTDGSEGAQDAPPSAGIEMGRQAKVFLDGSDLNNRSTASNVDIRISNEVIGEFQVLVNRFDATVGQSGTAVINAVSKSGSDQVHGNTYIYARDAKFNAEDFFTHTKPPFRNDQYGFTLGGPVVKSKTHYFFNYERQSTPQTIAPNTGFASLDQAVDSTDTRNLLFAKLEDRVTPNNRLTGSFNYYTRLQPHGGVGGTTVATNAINYDWTIYKYNAAFNSVFKNKWVNSVLFSTLQTRRLFGKVPGAGITQSFPAVTIGANIGGGLENPSYFLGKDDMAVFFDKGGQHNVKFGTSYEYAQVKGHFDQYVNGIFFYNQNPPNLATCCAGDDQSKWDESQFPAPTRYTQALGDPSINARTRIFSLYAQDDWRKNDRLTMNLGLRYDVEFGALGNDISGLVQKPFGNQVLNFQPRLGFVYDLTGDQKTMLRGGTGLYYSQVFLNVTFYVEQTNHVRLLTLNFFNNGNPNFAKDPLQGRTFADFQNLIGNPQFPLDVYILPPNTVTPHVWNSSIGLQRQILPEMVVSADFVYDTSHSQLHSVDTNLFCCLADGNAKPVNSGNYPELGGFIQGSGRPDPRFNNIRAYLTDGRANYKGLQLSLDKRFSHNYQFGATYLLSYNNDNLGQNGAQTFPSNQFNAADDYGRSVFDQRHRFTFNWVTRLPAGFSFSGLAFAASGMARSLTVGGKDIFGIAPVAQNQGARPTCGRDPAFTAACAALGVPNGTRVGVNPWTTDPSFRIDMRIARPIPLSRGMELQPSVEVFNVFNRQNNDPAAYNINMTSPRFMLPGPSSSLPYLPRQVQFGARFSF
jgi:carboxypeptidase family protein/TonB-dependent receptor-like protein